MADWIILKKLSTLNEGRKGGGGGPNPISQEIVFFKSQLKSHNPSLCCSNWNPILIFLLFFLHESQSQCTKSHFPASKKGKSQLPFYPFATLLNVSCECSQNNVFSGHIESYCCFVGSFGSFWLVFLVVVGGFGWFWLVPCFRNYVTRVRRRNNTKDITTHLFFLCGRVNWYHVHVGEFVLGEFTCGRTHWLPVQASTSCRRLRCQW